MNKIEAGNIAKGICAGIAIAVFVGQWLPGYQLDSTAKLAVTEASENMLSTERIRICEAQARATPGVVDELNAFTGYNDDNEFAAKQTWALAPGQDPDTLDDTVVKKCVDNLT